MLNQLLNIKKSSIMPSTSETGHAKNVANFETLISFCKGYGTYYNPSRDALKVANLEALLTKAKEAINNCTTKQTLFDNATDVRKDSFANIKPLGTKVVNALAVSGVDDSIIEGARTINRKLQGKRATTKKDTTSNAEGTTPPTAKNSISVSQLSYDYQIEHLYGLVELVSTHAEYQPNETELKVADLKTYITNLKALNTKVINANTEWSNSRVYRDSLLYTDKTGLVQIANDVKLYILSVFGKTSMQYKQVSKISFKGR